MDYDSQFTGRLTQWLRDHWQGVDEVSIDTTLSQPEGSGYSATTLITPVSVSRGGKREAQSIVVRMEPEAAIVYPKLCTAFDIEIELQYRAMELLHQHSQVPVAPLIGFEPDVSVLGLPFFVMEFIGGEVPIEDPIYTKEGFFVDATPEQRRQLLEQGLDTLADIHRANWRGADASWLNTEAPSLRRDLERWEAHGRKELAGREHPLIERAFAWLYRQLDAGRIDESDPVLCWGDARPGNMIWRNFECACVCDFESMGLGPAAMDVGWWLMFDRYSHEAQGAGRLPGEPSRDEQRAYYERVSGRELGDTFFFELYAAARYAILVVAVMNRWVGKGAIPEDHTIWLENPVAEMLGAMMDEGGIRRDDHDAAASSSGCARSNTKPE